MRAIVIITCTIFKLIMEVPLVKHCRQPFLVHFFLFFRKELPIVRLSSVKIIYVCGNLISNRPIDFKFGLNVR